MRNTRRRLEKSSVVWGTKAVKGRRTTAGSLAGASRRRQRDVLCDVMLSVSQCDTWLTLDELAMLTHYPPASISAQLRHCESRSLADTKWRSRSACRAGFCTARISERFGSTG